MGPAPPYTAAILGRACPLCAKSRHATGIFKTMRADAAEGGTSSCDVTRCVELGALRLLRYQFEMFGHSAELGKRTDVHLPHRLAAVDLHRSFGDAQFASYLFAEATTRPES